MPKDRERLPEPEPESQGLALELRLAVVLLGVQALGLVVAAGVLLEKTILGHPDSYPAALLGAALALGGAALLVAAARGILRGSSAARSPAIVMELLALPVGYSLAFQAGLVGYGAPILLSAVGVLYLFFTPAARAALDRE
ncbi:MAG: conserved rane protein of unknown function [Pseudonocardiales bacterium]|nr:conserved rane protein of unknown function [Pseudonocardiales bacterium]